MAFIKTGDAPIVDVYCSCGTKLTGNSKKCPTCADKLAASKEKDKTSSDT